MKTRVLIVEDEPPIAQAFKKQLTILGGFDVDVASGGEEGLHKLGSNDYDVVLLDIVMPDIDGIDVLKTVRSDTKQYKQTPVIALTNVTADDARKEMADLGVAKFLVKTTVKPEQLIEEIQKAHEGK
jgi:CheY-like chemotaxis protein